MDYKNTLNLPRTDFPLRPTPAHEDIALLTRWQDLNLSQRVEQCNQGSARYGIHDGPPYANGPIHLGHAYNKILKDIVAKSHRMMGYWVAVRPGWDCHGLPIELKVTTQNPGIADDRLGLMRACRAYAQEWIDIQRESFKRLGVLMSWDNPYITMSPSYEAATLRALGVLYAQGYVTRKLKTVAWCASCQTTLATAEIEYQDRTDPSVYVAFGIDQKRIDQMFPDIAGQQVSLLVWTTTPWTLPLNRAVMLHPQALYVLVRAGERLLIVGKEALGGLTTQLGGAPEVLYEFSASALAQCQVHHPFIDNLRVPVIFDASVGLHEGTACVHVAPGCGPIDYEIGVKQGLDIFCPVNAAGVYTTGIVPEELVGMSVRDGQGWVIRTLAQRGTLVYKGSIKHSYPHCWRCREGLIFRATSQWFIDLKHEHVQEKALQAIDTITFFPAGSRNFLKATIESRWEWCISRQRVWGVPLPALICDTCDRALMNEPLVHAVAQGIEHERVEFWEKIELSQLLPFLGNHPCAGHNLRKERDILDVWFDSGVSHTAVLKSDDQYPADAYIEGVDQHRGWFQSSLLTSMALYGTPCMKSIVSHGYTVDEKGRKMSKSLGNVVAPEEIIKQLGTDGLRLWVASLSNEGDLVVSPKFLTNVAEVYRKIRNTCRFMLQNLYDFDPARDAVDINSLNHLDRYAYARCMQVMGQIQQMYKDMRLTGVVHTLADYCTHDLSAQYLDMIKDRLYTDAATSHERRAAQTVLWTILRHVVHTVAPILSFTSEWLYDLIPGDKAASVHVTNFLVIDTDAHYAPSVWNTLWDVRDMVLKSLEELRVANVIRASLEAQVVLYIDPARVAHYDHLQAYLQSDFLREFLIVSQVKVVLAAHTSDKDMLPGVYVAATHAEGVKCPRCWQWYTGTPDNTLCGRCTHVVEPFSIS